MCEKLYCADSHLSSFEATVTDCRRDKKGWTLCLDKTAFFPEGGGQQGDTGYIGQARVWDTQEKDGQILHFCDRELRAGEKVQCRLDYEQRLRRMQNHSGEHIVSGLAHSLYGCTNVGFHMGVDCMTVDFDRELGQEEILRLESLANEAVRDNRRVRAWFPDEEELRSLDYRSKLELSENVRIVNIEGIDLCACCAPHVSYTGEVGLIKILEAERHRGGTRLSLVCGMDALDSCRRIFRANTEVSVLLSSKREDTAQAVERLIGERDGLKEKNAALSMRLISLMADSFGKTEGNICIFDDSLDEVALRELVNLLMEKCSGIAAAFSGSSEGGWRYIIGSRSLDMKKLCKTINAGIGGRGGGRGSMIMGSASRSREEIRSFIKGSDFSG